MAKEAKKEFVNNLTDTISGLTALVLVDFTGLNVQAQEELKGRLREVGAVMKVVKNTLFKRAGEAAKLPAGALEDSVLEGPTALIITKQDPIAPLQILGKFAKEFEVPQMKVGVIEGSFQDKDTLVKLSTLPSKEILQAQVVANIAGPMYGVVSTLNANMQKLVSIINEYSKSKSQHAKS